MMSEQLDRKTGIFACDKSSVFSNIPRVLGRKAKHNTEVIHTSLNAPIGGIYNMSLNTDIFLVVWRRIFHKEDYHKYDWTVKVDPDAVFLPARLRLRVASDEAQRDAGSAKGVFLNNCKIGNHGPIEVISTLGMEVFRKGVDRCIKKNYAPVDEIGEDVFTRRCWKHLGVTQLDDFHLLSEINCFENPTPCFSGKVVFHPFKTVPDFLQCLDQASHGESAPLPAACNALGCGRNFEPSHPCQCNEACIAHGNCCDDYEVICAKAGLIDEIIVKAGLI